MWHDLEFLHKITSSNEIESNFKGEFTSVDRISEIQDIVHAVDNCLESFIIDDSETLDSIRFELSILRKYLVSIVSEFDDAISRIEILSRSLTVSHPSNDSDVPVDELCGISKNDESLDHFEDRKSLNSSDEVIENIVPTATGGAFEARNYGKRRERKRKSSFGSLESNWRSLGNEIEWATNHWRASFLVDTEIDSLCLIERLRTYGVLFYSLLEHNRQSTQHTKLDFLGSSVDDNVITIQSSRSNDSIYNPESLYSVIFSLRELGFTFEKMSSGKYVTSLTAYPDAEVKRLLQKYLELGHDIWPGKNYMNGRDF